MSEIYTREEMLEYGAAPNPESNVPLTAANDMAQFWVNLKIVNVVGIFVNTSLSGWLSAPVVNINNVQPPLEPTDSLFYQVQMLALGLPVPEEDFLNQYGVSQWQPIVNSIGLQAATIQYMDQIDPGWQADTSKCAVVYSLPTNVAPPPPPPPPPPVPEDTGLASPNWLVWVATGCLAVRAGDTSPCDGSISYQDDKHGAWVKIADPTEPTPFAPKGGWVNPRWAPVLESE